MNDDKYTLKANEALKDGVVHSWKHLPKDRSASKTPMSMRKASRRSKNKQAHHVA